MSKKFLALSLALAAAGTAFAAGTPANTKIRNQAVADFTDSSGTRQTTKSNEVLTVVQSVFQYTITPDEATTGNTPARSTSVPNTGAPRYFAYYVTNSGNATDRIFLTPTLAGTSTIVGTPTFKLYYDSTPNGQVDSGEVELSKVSGVYYVDAAADQTVNIVAEVRLPVQATVAGTPRADYNLVGDSTNLTGTGDEFGNQNNTVSISVSNDASFAITKDANLADLVDRNGLLKYTIQGTNNGVTAASAVAVTVNGATRYGILIQDNLPVNGSGNQLEFLTTALGTTGPDNYVTSGRGVAVPIYNTGTLAAPVWTTTFSSSAVSVGMLIQNDATGTTDPGAFFQNGDQFTLAFTVRVDNDNNAANTPDANILKVGTPIDNTATVKFKKNPLDTGTTTPSNTRTNHVAPAYAVAVGQDDSGIAGTQGLDNSGTEETYTTGGNAYLGQTYTWTVYLTNNGNTDDQVRLNLDGALQLQNATISYTNGTSITAGSSIAIALGQTVTLRVTGTIPLSATTGSPAGIRLIADSTNVGGTIGISGKDVTVAGDAADTVILRSPNVTNPYAVDGAVDDAAASKTGDGDSSNDSTNTATAPAQYVKVNPGTTAYYPVEIRNTGTVQDSYDLVLPSGAVLHTFTDTNGDGNWDVGEPVGSAVSTTSPLNPNAFVNLVLSYPIASNQAPGDITVPVQARSTTLNTVSDSFNVIFQVQANNQVTFTPDRTGSVVPGGVVEYTHTLANNGNTYVQFDLAAAGTSGTSDKGLIYTYTTDGTTYVIDPAASAICVAPGGTFNVKVRVEAPSSVPIGTEDPEILSGVAGFYTDATCTTAVAGAGTQTLSVTDTTTVVGTLIKVEKKVKNLGPKVVDAGYSDNNTAYPGDTLEYKLDAYNNGNLDVYALVVSDQMPTDTTFEAFEVNTSSLPVATNVLVSADYDPLNPTAATWVDFDTIDGDNDNIVTASEWAAAFPAATFSTLVVGFDTDGDGSIEYSNTEDNIQPAKGATVLFRVKVK
ncbi:hypothetical protein [Deinococcus cellulosilyticus]|uniref:DUF11 domain-containing protein n=1 Tax=Deinococcus cellulosilyticus (strain DSM 18568 / NBRC 106333 / KACC 11606 / 5516J-15) TaxID=1223518 RepID=A0A511MYL6_DEIC1|nr:hypothetical protein [Deinococcus cellulosilyticus]GEM45237.1 hypothetical protein DC3_08720 [Deinococcus cellulosilyticus NBRC 106333 = KACC 11606]